MEKNQSEYPKLIKATTNKSLKISISGFKEYIYRISGRNNYFTFNVFDDEH